MDVIFKTTSGVALGTFYKVPCLPFTIGSVIAINVENPDKKMWDVTEVSGHYTVREIKPPYFGKIYPRSGRVDSITEVISVTVIVEEIK